MHPLYTDMEYIIKVAHKHWRYTRDKAVMIAVLFHALFADDVLDVRVLHGVVDAVRAGVCVLHVRLWTPGASAAGGGRALPRKVLHMLQPHPLLPHRAAPAQGPAHRHGQHQAEAAPAPAEGRSASFRPPGGCELTRPRSPRCSLSSPPHTALPATATTGRGHRKPQLHVQ
jgi:hypothetical protein